MEMISTVEKYGQPIDWILHLGDITAWGGCYSFWQSLYTEKPFHNYMWAGVNGNHDNMTRTNKGNTNKFFRDAAAYPLNGYEGELGVCYFFKYGDVLFIMLNNENMRSEEGLQKAQEWVKKVVAENPARYKVVCEHYQWFFGASGKDSQYPRWSKLFDELGITLALAGNNHIYASTASGRQHLTETATSYGQRLFTTTARAKNFTSTRNWKRSHVSDSKNSMTMSMSHYSACFRSSWIRSCRGTGICGT
jgi:hypothetical protein